MTSTTPKLGKVEFKGNRIFSDSILNERTVKHYIGHNFNKEVLESLIYGILNLYLENGFPFAKIRPLYMSEGKNGIEVVFEIDEGKAAVPRYIRIEGLKKTREDFLKKFFPYEGKLFKPSLLQESLDKLRFLPFLKYKGYHFEEDGELGLVLEFEEGKTGEVSGALGLDGKGKSLVGRLRLSFLNLFGTGKRFELQWGRLSLNSQNLRLRFFYPYITGLPVGVGGSYYFENIENVSYSTSLGGEILVLRGALLISIGFLREINKDPSRNFEEINTLSTGRVEYNREIPHILPVRGYKLEMQGAYSELKKRFDANFDIYIPLLGNFVLHSMARGFFVKKNSPLFLSEYFKIGGIRTLRGYREESLYEDEGTLIKGELLYLAGKGLFLYPFLDSFYGGGRLLYGYGFGLRGKYGPGILEIDYALSKERNPMNALIYVELGSRF